MLNLNVFKIKFMKDKKFDIVKTILKWIFICTIMVLSIETMQRGSIVKSFVFIKGHFSMFMLNLGIILSITSIAFLFKKRLAIFAILSGAILIFAAAGAVVMNFRGSPLTAADMYSVKDGIAIAKEYFGIVEIVIILLLIAAMIAGVVFLFKKAKKRESSSILKNILIFIIPAFIFTFVSYKYNREHNNIKLYRWDLTTTYKENGYLVSFIDSAKELIPTKPETYNQARMDKIKNGLDESSAAVMANKTKPNIIVVQLESFIDPYRLKGVEFSEDPIPNIRRIQEQGPQGMITVPCFGGGTVRSEFEVLTGYAANNLGPGEIPNNTVLKKQSVESMAYILKNQGYDTTAIHNYLGNFYNRDEVYSNFGFDNLVTQEYIDDLQSKYDYPSDMNNLKSVKEVIVRDEPQFVFNVAVESHGPYDDDYKAEKYTVSGNISEVEKNQIQEYVDKAHEVDKYVEELIKYVESTGEPTIIAMYGDHLPALDAVNNPDIYPSDQKYETEYFIWSNTGVKPTEKNIEAYQLSAYVLGLAGIDAGIMPEFHKTYAGDEKYQEYLKDLQFDQLYGENYLLGQKIYKKSDMKLGINPIKVTKAYIDGNSLIVEGENLTRASKVMVKGKPIQTTYESANKIVAKGFKENVKSIQVGQEAMYGKMLSKTDEVQVEK